MSDRNLNLLCATGLVAVISVAAYCLVRGGLFPIAKRPRHAAMVLAGVAMVVGAIAVVTLGGETLIENILPFGLMLALFCLLNVGDRLIRRGIAGTRFGANPHCASCDYLLIGIEIGRCPECGTALDASTIVRGERRLRVGRIVIGALIFLAIFSVGILPFLRPPMNSPVSRAKITAARADVSNLRFAIEEYHNDIGSYPTTAQGLNALVNPPAGRSSYIITAPIDPWGNSYRYRSPGTNGATYDIYSCGPSGTPGAPDNIK